YGTVFVIFVCNALGFIAAAFFIGALSQKAGTAKVLIIAQALLILGYAVIIITPPFPAVAASVANLESRFFVLGVSAAINLAIAQVFCSNLPNNTGVLGGYQASYGIGGISGPLIATTFISSGKIWSRFYVIELGLAAFNLNYKLKSVSDFSPATDERFNDGRHESKTRRFSQRKLQSFKLLISNKPTTLGACFIFAYQGAEVAISGWVISFLVQFRHGDPNKVGFVTAGFWGGITLGKPAGSEELITTYFETGRCTLSFVGHRIGERLFIFIVTAGYFILSFFSIAVSLMSPHSIVLELLIWFAPSIVGNSVAVAFSGLILGPVYPCATHIFQRLIPRKMPISSLSLIGSVGSSGGAIAPFMTGMIAQRAGTFVLHPICIGLFVCLGAPGGFFRGRRRDRNDLSNLNIGINSKVI
ncbi:MFS general substrate transporter, partial [Penicillium cosmopolitanum]